MFSCQIIHFKSATMTSPKWEITLSALTLIWLLLPLNCLCESSNGESILTTTSGSEQREFDLFVLALQWSGTICQRTYRCCPSNGCCRSSNAPSGFTIHGLWTDYNDGTWPSCCRGPRFDLKEIAPLLEGLQKYWPSLTCSGSSTCHGGKGLFWAHEWEKHGTCASSVLRDEYSYFLATINLYLKYNITEILIEAGYTPSNKEKYPLGGIISAIEVAVGATPLIVCSHGAVEELRICFYKDFQPRDCMFDTGSHSNTVASSSCPRYVSLPEYTHEWPWKRDNKNMITQSQSM